MKTLTMTKKETMDYCSKNQYATMMFYAASDDYVASRCCILNGLAPGFILASQAIEKILKAIIFLETKRQTGLKKDDKHNPFSLKNELTAKTKKYSELNKFDEQLKKLFGHYNRRYHDGDRKKQSKGMDTSELKIIDELWVILIEIMPMPDEVKYRMRFFAELCDGLARKFFKAYYWATLNNDSLEAKLDDINKQYKEVFNHLYPTNKS